MRSFRNDPIKSSKFKNNVILSPLFTYLICILLIYANFLGKISNILVTFKVIKVTKVSNVTKNVSNSNRRSEILKGLIYML